MPLMLYVVLRRVTPRYAVLRRDTPCYAEIRRDTSIILNKSFLSFYFSFIPRCWCTYHELNGLELLLCCVLNEGAFPYNQFANPD